MNPLFVFAAGQPLFGNQWLALLAILAGIAVFIGLVAAMGRWLAATHPDGPPPAIVAEERAEAAEEAASVAPGPEVLAVIAAAVAAVFGAHARVTAVQFPVHHQSPSVEALMVQWSLEGRRQIYSSHKVR